MYDSTGCVPKCLKKAWNWFEEKVVEPVVDAVEKIFSVPEEVHYESSATGNGAKIVGSHNITNPIVMYQYIEENRGDEIAGSTIGVVFEIVHNAAYATGKTLCAVGFTDLGQDLIGKGKDLDVGRTIYDDQHGGLSWVMWIAYGTTSPFIAIYDLVIKVLD